MVLFRQSLKIKLTRLLQDGRALITILLNQPDTEMKSVVDGLQLQRSVGKSFTEFLLYIIKLFLKAIEDKIITMKNSVKQSVMSELNHIFLILIYIQRHFEDKESNDDEHMYKPDDSVAIVVKCATKVTDIIRSLQKKQRLGWF